MCTFQILQKIELTFLHCLAFSLLPFKIWYQWILRGGHRIRDQQVLYSAVDNFTIILIFSCVWTRQRWHLFKLWDIDCDILSNTDIWTSRCLIQDFLDLFCCSLKEISDFAFLRSLDAVFRLFWTYDGQSGLLNISTFPLGCVLLWWRSSRGLECQCDGWKENPWRGLLCRIYGGTWERNDEPIIFYLLCCLFYQFVLF